LKRNLRGSVSKRFLAVPPFILLCLVSCATKPVHSPYAPVYVTDHARYFLLPPSSIALPLDMPQQLAGRHGDQEFLLDAWVKADETGIAIALFNALGADMGQLSFDTRGISFVSTVFPPGLPPEYIAADFQFCFYPVDALVPALKASGLTMIAAIHDGVAPEGGKEVRTIYSGKKRIIEIVKTEETVQYANFLRDYSYTLRGAF
jgi:hypothetical protein